MIEQISQLNPVAQVVAIIIGAILLVVGGIIFLLFSMVMLGGSIEITKTPIEEKKEGKK